VILTRAAFASVPEPPDYFGLDPTLMTVRLITEQTALLVTYISEQLFSG